MLGFNEIRKGKVIVYEGEPYVVVAANFLRKQQRRPVMKTKLRGLKTGATKEHSFQQSDKVVEADVERREAQFLYRDGNQLQFMDTTTYEQFVVESEMVAEIGLLIEGSAVEVLVFEGKPITVELPIKIERKVIEAPPGVRGDTSSAGMKDVVIEGGVTIKAPMFVKVGDVIRVDTRDVSYLERA